METKSYDFTWIRFLSNQVPVKVCNEADFAQFKRFLLSKGLIGILKDDLEFKDWVLLAMVNHTNPKLFLFEYSNSKGLTWRITKKTPSSGMVKSASPKTCGLDITSFQLTIIFLNNPAVYCGG